MQLKKKNLGAIWLFSGVEHVSQATGTNLTLLGFKSRESYYGCKM